jgi:photosystem II stability/assembly factor-like uncharacterized protein
MNPRSPLRLLARLVLLGALLAAPAVGQTQREPAHEMFVCVSMSSAFVIGSNVPLLNGLYRTTDRREIVHFGFNHPRQDALAADPRDPSVLYTAGLNGVMRTLDGGNTWRIMTSWDMTEPKDVAVDPHRPDRVVAALPDGIGVSEDRGQTWTRRQQGIRRAYTQSIVLDRHVADRWVAGTELGIYVSEDAGRSWSKQHTTRATVTDVQQSPHDPRHYLAATQSDGLWESRDHGRSWQRVRGLPIENTMHNVNFDPANPQRLAVSGWALGVRVSEDGGRTWHERSNGLPNPNVWRVGADPDFPGRLYASPHGSPIFVSDDFGRTWRRHWFEGATVWDFVFVQRQTSARR